MVLFTNPVPPKSSITNPPTRPNPHPRPSETPNASDIKYITAQYHRDQEKADAAVAGYLKTMGDLFDQKGKYFGKDFATRLAGLNQLIEWSELAHSSADACAKGRATAIHILGRSDPGHDFAEAKAIKWAADNKNSTENAKAQKAKELDANIKAGKPKPAADAKKAAEQAEEAKEKAAAKKAGRVDLH